MFLYKVAFLATFFVTQLNKILNLLPNEFRITSIQLFARKGSAELPGFGFYPSRKNRLLR